MSGHRDHNRLLLELQRKMTDSSSSLSEIALTDSTRWTYLWVCTKEKMYFFHSVRILYLDCKKAHATSEQSTAAMAWAVPYSLFVCNKYSSHTYVQMVKFRYENHESLWLLLLRWCIWQSQVTLYFLRKNQKIFVPHGSCDRNLSNREQSLPSNK